MLESSHFRKGTALGMALEFCAWLTVSALTACPFLQADLSAAKHPRPRTNAPPSCPLTKAVPDGPSYATESKTGVKESAQLHAIALPVMSSIPIADTSHLERFRADRLPDGSNLLLRIHVLRI